jgi:hypothetical protein
MEKTKRVKRGDMKREATEGDDKTPEPGTANAEIRAEDQSPKDKKA